MFKKKVASATFFYPDLIEGEPYGKMSEDNSIVLLERCSRICHHFLHDNLL